MLPLTPKWDWMCVVVSLPPHNTYTRTHINTYICTYIHTHECVCMYTCTINSVIFCLQHAHDHIYPAWSCQLLHETDHVSLWLFFPQYLYVYTHICIHMHTYTRMCTYECTANTFIFRLQHAHDDVYPGWSCQLPHETDRVSLWLLLIIICTHTYTYIHICIHTHTHTCMHTCTCLCMYH